MKPITSRLALATALSLAFSGNPVLAQDDTDDGPERDDTHFDSEILVSAPGVEDLDILASTSVLGPEDIQRNLNGQIGEVLAKLPGVSASSFTPGASRPILRGFDGERVRILVDGIGTADVSNTSADHAVTIDPLTVQRIEVLRGPASLLYGSQAIGGVVNVIDKRIPLTVPDEAFHLDAIAAIDSATDLRSAGASLDVPLGSNFVFHVDGSWRETDDVEIPGFQLADGLRSELLEEADEEEAEGEFEEAEEFREAANQQGFIPNSGTETWTANAGFGVFFGESSFGASVGWYDTDYGLVGRPGAGHHHGEDEGGEGGETEEEEEEEEIVTIGLEQFRADFRGDIALGGGFFSQLKLRAGYSDYTHTEFEGDEVGTVFDTESFEARAELIQQSGGAFGIQYTTRDFSAVGEEAFVAPNETEQLAVFALQEIDLGGIQLEGAARYEMVDVQSDPLGIERDFDLFSGALSLVFSGSENSDVRYGITGSRAERAPGGEELFADGPHIATQAFEIGDPDLDVESAWGVEAFARGSAGDVTFGISVYQQWFDNFIFLSPTGEEEDELPVFQFLQQDADYFGFEADIQFPLITSDSLRLIGDVRGSYVEAELDDGSAVPRIPPLEILAALEAQTKAFDVRAELQYFDEQDSIAEFETATDSFSLVNFSIAWRPLANQENVTVLVSADNVFDVTARRHSSFTKDFVPLAGRNFKASVAVSF
ncbi:MAG: TonB-dependent receptor [Pseudomonadota bacterium]